VGSADAAVKTPASEPEKNVKDSVKPSPLPPVSTAPPDPREIFQTASKSVVFIKTFDANNIPLLIGSGFIVKNPRADEIVKRAEASTQEGGPVNPPKKSIPLDKLSEVGGLNAAVVTNAHVIAGAKRIVYEDQDGKVTEVTEVLALDAKSDLAILVGATLFHVSPTERDLPELKLSRQIPDIGERIFVIGNPHGLTQSFSDGIVSARRSFEGAPVIQITAPISPGSSGGPVLNSLGEVVGVASFFIQGGENLNFAISARTLDALFSDLKLLPVDAAVSQIDTTRNGEERSLRRGRIQIAGIGNSSTEAPNSVSITLRNGENDSIGTIALRVSYTKDPSDELKAKLAQSEAEEQKYAVDISGGVGAYEAPVHQLEAYRAVLARDPMTWGYSDLKIIPEGSAVYSNGKALISGEATSDYVRDIWLRDVRSNIPEEQSKTETALANAKTQLARANAALTAEQQQLLIAQVRSAEIRAQLKSPTVPIPMDYEDIVVTANIASGLTRTLDVTLSRWRQGWRWNCEVLDYEILKTQ
jgi:S1-C subfamily serine protease